MKAILTGMNGTVAPALAKTLEAAGHSIVAWNRTLISPDDAGRSEQFIRDEKPDWFFQIATGSPDWIENTARICRELNIKFLFTGSVSVFDGSKSGPFAVDHEMDATDDYGKYKADCERRITAVNPDAIIARLGWQIGEAPGNNNMIDYFTTQQKEHGEIVTSTGWIPSTAFLTDTVDGLHRLIRDYHAGLYQLEGNSNGLSFFEIATALNNRRGNPWIITAKDEPRRDNRMLDDKIEISALNNRL